MPLINKIQNFIGSAISGGDVLTSTQIETTPGTSIVYKKEQGSKLMNDLINKELTEEVKQLRYRTYWVEEESRKYQVVSDGHDISLLKKEYADFTKPNVFEENNKKVFLVQNTEPISSGFENNVQIQKEGVKFVQYYPLKIKREDYFPKFKFEKYCKQIVLKEIENNFQFDLYMNVVPSIDDRIERNLTFELEKVFNKQQKIYNLDYFYLIEFVTKEAWGNKNNIKYILSDIEYIGINKFSSFYVLHYIFKKLICEDLIEQYYNENIVKEYNNKTKRPNMNVPFDIINNAPQGTFDSYYCEICGKELKGIERNDYILTKSFRGVGMCKECLRIQEENEKKI